MGALQKMKKILSPLFVLFGAFFSLMAVAKANPAAQSTLQAPGAPGGFATAESEVAPDVSYVALSKYEAFVQTNSGPAVPSISPPPFNFLAQVVAASAYSVSIATIGVPTGGMFP